MAHSPYTKTVHPPIQDMEEYEQLLRRVRTDFEDGEQEDYYFEPLLSAGEELLEHCEFLSAKLSIKKHSLDKVNKENEMLKEKVEALQEEIKSLKEHMATTQDQDNTHQSGGGGGGGVIGSDDTVGTGKDSGVTSQVDASGTKSAKKKRKLPQKKAVEI